MNGSGGALGYRLCSRSRRIRSTVCVEPATPLELSVMTSVAVARPSVRGLKTTVMVHEAPAARVAGILPQVLVSEKSAACGPVIVMLLIIRLPAPAGPQILPRRG